MKCERVLRSHFNFILEVFFISKETQQINSEIKDKELRVISADGEQLGIMSASDALLIAVINFRELVLFAPQAKPSVC